MRRATYILSIAFLIVFSIIIYANTLKNGFLFDDFGTIVNNNHLIKTPGKFSILINQKEYFDYSGEITYRPVATLSYMLDYALYGLKPWGYHLTNIIFHAENGILLYVFLAMLTKESRVRIPTLLITSLLFVSHPVLTETVNAISFREDLLAFFFYMASLNLYLILRQDRIVRYKPFALYLLYAVSCILYFLALLSKEIAATLPLIVYCYEWIYVDRKKEEFYSILSNRYNIGYIAITLFYLYLRFFYFYNPVEENVSVPALVERIVTIPWLIVSFIKLAVFPVSLSADYEAVFTRPVFSLSFIVPSVIALFLSIAFVGRRNREILFGILFFIISLVPVYNVIPIAHPFAERYLYLPIVGFIIVAGFIINMILKTWRGYTLLLIILIVAVYSFNVVKRNSVWRDGYSLWSDTVKNRPKNNLAHYNLALVYYREGRLMEAAQELDIAIRLKPDRAEQHFALAQVYEKQGRFIEATTEYEKTISIEPNDERYHGDIAILYMKQGMVDRAINEFEIAYRLNPSDPKIYNNLKLAHERLKTSGKQDLKKH